MPHISIHCARCNRPVERQRMREDHSTEGRLFEVWCHGEYQSCRVDRDFFFRALDGQVTSIAFETSPFVAPIMPPAGEKKIMLQLHYEMKSPDLLAVVDCETKAPIHFVWIDRRTIEIDAAFSGRAQIIWRLRKPRETSPET